MSNKLNARERLCAAAINMVRCRDKGADVKKATDAHEQAARDFAAAEILERYQRPRPPPGPDENAKTDDEWLRAGGLAQEVGDE